MKTCIGVTYKALPEAVIVTVHVLYCKVDVHQLKYYYMEDDGGGLLMSKVHPQVKAAVTKVTHFNLLNCCSFLSLSYTSVLMLRHKQQDPVAICCFS